MPIDFARKLGVGGLINQEEGFLLRNQIKKEGFQGKPSFFGRNAQVS
jgi:hypothetical protein